VIPRGVQLWTIGSDTCKAEVYARLRLQDGPKSFAFARDLPMLFFDQLTSERQVVRFHRGVRRVEWVLPGGARNEALDATALAMVAALRIGLSRLDWDRREAAISDGPADRAAAPHELPTTRSAFVDAW
jgi:phage terminase large subunit GpA-like protein